MVGPFGSRGLEQYLVSYKPDSTRAASEMARLRELLPHVPGAQELNAYPNAANPSHIVVEIPEAVGQSLIGEFGNHLFIEKNSLLKPA
ncbi:MAG: hypothetical protein JO110_28160 [Acetobacteraceae bacterium]|nr:hypothetical protein [Acetobacteraceae bacterium]